MKTRSTRGGPRWGLGIVALALLSGCDCRSRETVANQVFANAVQVSTTPAAPVGPVARCAPMPGALLAELDDAPTELRAFDRTTYLLSPTLAAIGQDGRRTELAHESDDITHFDVSAAGVFSVLQTKVAPITHRIAWRAPNGTTVRHALPRELLANDVLATDDGACLLLGRVLDSQGPASQLAFFSTIRGELEPLLDRDRGALYLTRDAEHLYWIEYPHTGRGQSGVSTIVAYDISTRRAHVLAESDRTLSALAVDDRYLYWLEREGSADDAELRRMPKAGGRATTIRIMTSGASFLLAAGALFTPANRNQIQRIDPESGRVVTLVDDADGVASIAIADGRLVWSSGFIDGTRKKFCVRALTL